MKLIDLLVRSAGAAPEQTACIQGALRVSYAELLRWVEALAGQLREMGCGPGVKVALLLGNSVEYLAGFFAISRARGTIVPLSAGLTAREVSGYLICADISLIVTGRSAPSWLDEVAGGVISVVYLHYGEGRGLDVARQRRAYCRSEGSEHDVALMVPTSGSTGVSRMVMLTDENLISNMLAYSAAMALDDRHIAYCTLPLVHIYPICAEIITHISRGDTLAINDRPFFVRDFFRAVEDFGVTMSALVPYMAMLLADFPMAEKYRLGSLKYITLSGAKTPVMVFKRLQERYPEIRFVSLYGMTEAGSRITVASPQEAPCPLDSVGKAVPGAIVSVIDGSGRVVGRNTVGQIVVKSSGVMQGYYKQPDLTRETLAGGFLHTGDLGRIDEQGNVYLVGRLKDIILSGGHNIYPDEVEACLLEHPQVAAAAVVAQSDALLQEKPCAFVVKKNGAEVLDAGEVQRWCGQRLSRYKIPRRVIFLEELPQLINTKIDRARLRQMAEEAAQKVGER